MFPVIEQLKKQIEDAVDKVKSGHELEQFRLKFLAGSGELKKLMTHIKDIPGEQKREFGKHANDLKTWVETKFEELKTNLGGAKPQAAGPRIDVTEPGLSPRVGRPHVITQTIDDLCDVFGRMGFDVATGPEVEDERHNFVALNIPRTHPARDPLDNFYIDMPEMFGGKAGSPGTMLRSQTSTIQIRIMEKAPPPIRVIATGRVYRPDEHDATHFSMFHQVEGLSIDRKVSMADLKTTLFQFAHAYFGAEAEVRFRPSYFPFTEPSAEVDVKMMLGGQWQWKEVGGCGMVNPAVLEACGVNPEEWTGFAFGLGIERLAMRKYNIQDIRLLFENDVRFLRQF